MDSNMVLSKCSNEFCDISNLLNRRDIYRDSVNKCQIRSASPYVPPVSRARQTGSETERDSREVRLVWELSSYNGFQAFTPCPRRKKKRTGPTVAVVETLETAVVFEET